MREPSESSPAEAQPVEVQPAESRGAEPHAEQPPAEASGGGGSRAAVVAAGIFSSRIVGFVRERVIAHFFGGSAFTDVFTTAFRGPNVLQVLFGEQTLSAAFIPIYARMVEQGREEEAGRFAGAVFGLLLALAAALSVAGILLARPIVAIFATGYLNDAAQVAAGTMEVNRFELSVRAVRWIFPMTGLLMLSAWCLGVLNSHRRFFLSYFAPVLWNVSIIATLGTAGALWLGPTAGIDAASRVLLVTCAGALVGGLLQFLVQLPLALRLLTGLRISVSTRVAGVRESLRAFGPVLAGRGVVQLSLYLDHFLASFLAVGAISAIRWGSFLYALPVSLFGISVAAAELPELARVADGPADRLLQRTRRSLRQMSFLVLPTAVGYLIFGYLVTGLLYRSGEFSVTDQWLVYLVLAAYSLGLPASTASRLLQNLFYALGDTRSPAKVAALRVAVGSAIGAGLMLWLDHFTVSDTVGQVVSSGGLGPDVLFLGAVGLAVGSAVGSWVELVSLRRVLATRLPAPPPVAPPGRFLLLALAAGVPAVLLWLVLPAWHVAFQAMLVLAVYAALYLGAAAAFRLPELESWWSLLRRRRRKASGDSKH
ncbi:MAG: murein biosynthesis integral membrane protein MurJ [Acidobacteriota bacterium]|nr:murein biosynthesis integral membrane protein MurJ [Acidobacteriota bacterium]